MQLVTTILQVLQALSAFVMIVLVLLHSPKGDGFGGLSGAAQLFSSQKGAESALNKTTTTVAALFFLVSFILGYYL